MKGGQLNWTAREDSSAAEVTPEDSQEAEKINITSHACFLDGGRMPEYRERTQGEHANSTQKGSSWDSSCYEVRMLTTRPLCSPSPEYINTVKVTCISAL